MDGAGVHALTKLTQYVEMKGGGPYALRAGQIGARGELALALLASLRHCHLRYDRDAAVRRYAQWLRSEPFYIDEVVRRALGGARSTDHVLRNAARLNKDVRSNEALVRLFPLIALAESGTDAETVALYAAEDAALTNPDAMAREYCSAFAYLVALLAREWQRHTIAEILDMTVQRYRFVVELAMNVPPVADDHNKHYMGVALQMAIFCLRRSISFKDALSRVVRYGGDTEANAIVCGALLGAAYGERTLPEDWCAVVFERFDFSKTAHERDFMLADYVEQLR
jgi:ADP-ribosylglycohydrolase